MPFVTSTGYKIHYAVEGSGPLVVLLHGLLSDAASWKRWGFVEALKDNFCVACVDSLGHGLSDKPPTAPRYGLGPRSDDIVAVIDDLGRERAHLIGYSMGGWLASGLAKAHRERLSSLVIGGWDILQGVGRANPRGSDSAAHFLGLLAAARTSTPAMVAWVTPEMESGLCACWAALSDLDGARDAVLQVGVPTLLWSGRDDPNHAPMERFAADGGLKFLSSDGDHQSAIWRHGRDAAMKIGDFLRSIESPVAT